MKTLRILSVVFFTVFSILACQDPLPAKPIPLNEFKERISNIDTLQLIDVRTSDEFQEGHIEHAQNIDYFQEEAFKNYFSTYDKDETLFLYCRSGNRSQKAAAILKEMGFKHIFDLKGGYSAWSENKE